MNFIELDNTFGGFRSLKRDLTRVMSFISYTSMLLFSAYYIYLIFQNLNQTLYLIIYSVLFSLILLSFILEISLKDKGYLDRKTKRVRIENKRKYKMLIKIPKYLLKGFIIGVALFESIKNADFQLNNIINIILAVFLLLQILTDIITHYVIYYVEFMIKCVEQDIKQSGVVQFFQKFNVKKQAANHLEDIAYKLSNESKYTKQEEKMFKKIEDEKIKYKSDKKRELNQNLRNNLKTIVQAGTSKVKEFLYQNDDDKKAQ
ncbi:MAG: hypothetical protein IKB42_03470 [Clostridia bacterium]|nr:hypothetical protein [Clostridia bacterium]